MDRRGKDYGGIQQIYTIYPSTPIDRYEMQTVNRRSGQDRRKCDKLAEAMEHTTSYAWVEPETENDKGHWHFDHLNQALRILITMMERRGKA